MANYSSFEELEVRTFLNSTNLESIIQKTKMTLDEQVNIMSSPVLLFNLELSTS